MQYVWLAISWVLFGLVHSVFAASKIKQWAKKIMQSRYAYYRLIYSSLATIALALVLYYYFSVPQQLLWADSLVEKAIAVAIFIPAVVIMAVTIKKYFMDLSGIDVLLKRTAAPAHLEQTGLHKYMRHPLYSGTLLFVWSIFVWQPSLTNLVSCICITLYTRIGIYFEEKKLVLEFGDAYKQYAKKTPMLVPGIR